MNLQDHDLNMTISEATQKHHFLSQSYYCFSPFSAQLGLFFLGASLSLHCIPMSTWKRKHQEIARLVWFSRQYGMLY